MHDKIGTTGVVGILRNGDGPTVLMRADMDGAADEGGHRPSVRQHRPARPTRRARTVPVAHACGHDVHVASLMGAARLLAAERDRHGAARSSPLFQPAEERGTGAQAMVDGGLSQLIPKPDVALAQHVLAYPSGTVGTLAGPFLSTAASMRVTVHGRGGHGSMPHLSIDPVVLAAMIVVRLQAIVAREVPPGDFAVADRRPARRRDEEQHHPRSRRHRAQHPRLRATTRDAADRRDQARRQRRVRGIRLAARTRSSSSTTSTR